MTGLNVGLVLLVSAGLVPGGLLLLRRFAREGARARVELAAAGAVESVRRQAEETLSSARLLAERPTVRGLVGGAADEELTSFLGRFRRASGLDGCAVFTRSGFSGGDPTAFPWERVEPWAGPGIRYLPLSDDPSAAPAIMAGSPLLGEVEGTAVAISLLGGPLLERLEHQVGLPIHIIWVDEGEHLETGLEDGVWRARRHIIAAPDGGGVGVELELQNAEVMAALRPLERTFALVTGAAILVALGAGFVGARRFSRPITDLRIAALGIAGGDLSTPIPPEPGVEAGALAATMEGMRRRLQSTTAELNQREKEARELLEGIVEGVFAVDGERRIQYLSPQASLRLGIPVEEALGKFCGDVLRPVPRDGLRPCEDACPIIHARSRGSSKSVEHLQLQDGQRTMIITSAPPMVSSFNVPHFSRRQVQLMRDETELEAARRSRDSVLSNVSHELKTPLSAQMASIQLLQDALGDEASEEALELVDSLERSTLRLRRLIDNLLESVRIDTGRASLRSVPVDLAAVIYEAEAMTYPLLRQRRQEIVVDLPPDLAAVRGDPIQLTQVFVNLISNANKYAPEGSTIRVGGASDARLTSVWVEDAGPGIPPAERGSIFEHYYRADPGAAEGMGLGLWIVKALVERHGGEVLVSAPAGGGARFTVDLPRMRTP
jgi:signal transduction histidine kinase/HAMP domain-containing protein